MLTHNDLINLGTQLGYQDLEDGLCNGFNCMWLQAYFCGQLPKFYTRLRLIHEYKNRFPLLVEQIKAAQLDKKKHLDNREILEILAFYEGITLYFKPEGYRFLFPDHPTINQENISIIFELIKPVLLNDQQLNLYFDHQYVLTEEESIKLFSTFITIFNSSTIPVGLLVSNSRHTASLIFDHKSSKWLYMDVNILNNSESEHYHWEIDTHELVQFLQNSFQTTVNLSFNVKIFSTDHNFQVKEQFHHLLDYPAQRIGARDSHGVGLLYLACQNGNINHVKQLLDYGYALELHYKDNNGTTPFLVTCMYGYSDILSLLLNSPNSWDVNESTNDGSTALHLACVNGHINIVQKLLKHPALNINQTNHKGTTSFYLACQKGYDEIVALLLRQKQLHTIDIRAIKGHTPLMVACLSPHTRNNKKLFALLLLHGASLSLKNHANQTALDIAVNTENPAAIDILSLWLLCYPQQISESMALNTFIHMNKKYLHRSRIKKQPQKFFDTARSSNEPESINHCSFDI